MYVPTVYEWMLGRNQVRFDRNQARILKRDD